MLVLIDECGDAGFKLAKGSTPYFVVAMVIFRDFKQAELASAAITDARVRLKVKQEFKFSKSHANIRDEFFKAAAPYEYGVRALVVDKEKIYSPHLREEKDQFYSYFVKQLMKYDNDVLTGAKVKIDGSGDREFKRELGAYLRRHLKGKIKDVKMEESHRNNLIQLADMVAGAIGRSYRTDDRNDPRRWLNQLRATKKIEDIWDFK